MGRRKEGMIDRWAAATREAAKRGASERDPAFLERLLPAMELMGRYFDSEVWGFERLPERGPMLLVGNHSGGALTPDTPALLAAWYRHRGLEDPLVGLAFDAVFGIPGARSLMRKIGQIPASPGNAARALEDGASVLVYPGGVHEVYRPWTHRNRIDFGGRKGFVRLALRTGVPVVPVVGHGGHETTVVLSRGERLARLARLDRLRCNAYPILLQVPWGISNPAFPSLPLPAKITVQLLEPMDWSRYRPEDADDPEVVDRLYAEITDRMQQTLTALAERRPSALGARLSGLLRRERRRAPMPREPRPERAAPAVAELHAA